MKITVERFDWTRQEPDLVVLVGDPYQSFAGSFSGPLGEKIAQLEEGFTSGKLSREISFSLPHHDSGRLVDYLYFHTSLEKGFTATENLKTFLSRALRLAAETGRKTVGLCLRGPDGEGLIEQLVEGALVGTFKFNEYLKDRTDRYEDMELVLYPPTPAPTYSEPAPVEQPAPEEPVAPVLESVAEAATEPVESIQEPITDLTSEGDDFTVGDDADPFPPAPEEASSEEELSAEQTDSESPSDTAEAEPEAAPDAPEVAPEPVASTSPTEALDLGELASLLEPSWSEEEKTAWQTRDEAAVQVGAAFGRGVNFARTLIASPASVCTPEYLAKAGEALAKKYGFSYQAFGLKDLNKHGYVGHVAVGGGSAHQPRMFELTYQPAVETNVHLVLLGKGVTFDTGGISIKPADKMHLMVGDMSGAAAVLGAMDILGQLNPGIKVTGLVVSAENSPDGNSFRPGDILRYKNGLSVHIENTDAEGRLLLADGLIRAGELGATHVIDIATLTGACARALGPSFTGVMGANRKLVNAITRAGGNHGESYWRLPLPVEYRSMLKTVHADLNNVGGPEAGATTAGLFLQEFVPPRTVWAHLDIAGTFWKSKPWKYYQEGPSGAGVKTLADLALRWQEHMA